MAVLRQAHKGWSGMPNAFALLFLLSESLLTFVSLFKHRKSIGKGMGNP